MKHAKGITYFEFLIVVGVLGMLATFAIPAYKNFKMRESYHEVIEAAAPFKAGVSECYQVSHNLAVCDAGTNRVPAAITQPKGKIASITVVDGVITVIPVPYNGFTAKHSYIMTPVIKGKEVTWKASGGAVDDGFAS
ncbi:MAG: pilus assembly protein PilA [Gammaproteobacteria bacterium]